MWTKSTTRQILSDINTSLILTEFEVRTVNNGPSFFSLINGPSAKRAGHKSTRKKRRSVTYSTDRENEINKIFTISLRLIGREGKETSWSKRAVQWTEYGRQNWPNTSRTKLRDITIHVCFSQCTSRRNSVNHAIWLVTCSCGYGLHTQHITLDLPAGEYICF